LGVEGETIDDIADFTFGPVDFTEEKYKIESLLFRGQQNEVFVNDSVVGISVQDVGEQRPIIFYSRGDNLAGGTGEHSQRRVEFQCHQVLWTIV